MQAATAHAAATIAACLAKGAKLWHCRCDVSLGLATAVSKTKHPSIASKRTQRLRSRLFDSQPRRHHASSALIILIFALLNCVPGAAADERATSSDLLRLFSEFGFGEHDLRAVEAGEIVTASRPPSLDNELVATAAMRLPASVADLGRHLRDGLNILADSSLIAFAEIRDVSNTDTWEGVEFSAGDRKDEREVSKLFAVAPGNEFNLSQTEITTLKQRLGQLRDGDRDAIAHASAAYRAVLLGRYREYREQGPIGLAEYDRGGETSSPARAFETIDRAPYVPSSLRVFIERVNRFPLAASSGIENHLFWKKNIVDDRRAFVLSHVAMSQNANALRFLLREYFVSHSYDVLEQIGIAVPDGDGSILLVVNSTVTDRISGIFGGLARAIGQQRSRDALINYFQEIHDLTSRPMTSAK
jgi:hypothetical protein